MQQPRSEAGAGLHVQISASELIQSQNKMTTVTATERTALAATSTQRACSMHLESRAWLEDIRQVTDSSSEAQWSTTKSLPESHLDVPMVP